jgi:hypothetical protein
LAAHFATDAAEALTDAGDAATPVDLAEAGDAAAVPTLGGGTTTCEFSGAGPPIVFGLVGPGPPITVGFFTPPTAVCAVAGCEKAHAHSKTTVIAVPLFM